MASYFLSTNDQHHIYKREDSEIDNTGNEDSDDSAETENQNRSKKPINKGRWSKEEDARLKQLVEEYSEKWDVIANHFEDRSDVQCQQRWTKVVNPDLVKGPWTKEEDEKVIELVNKYGAKKWTLIARHLKGRIGKQCREVAQPPQSEDQKKCLDRSRRRNHIPSTSPTRKPMGQDSKDVARTDNAIKNHWNSTMRRKYESENRENGESRRGRQRKNQRQNTLNLYSNYSGLRNHTGEMETGNGPGKHEDVSVYAGDWAVEMYDQASSQSSGGPPTPALPPCRDEKPSPYAYTGVSISSGNSYPEKSTPVKLTPLNDEAMSDFDMSFYNSPGVSPLKTNNSQFIKARVVLPSSYSHNGNSAGNIVPVPNILSITRATTPPILRRGGRSRRPRRDSRDHDVPAAQDPSDTPTTQMASRFDDLDLLLDGGRPTVFSPLRGAASSSPVKQLPFSPSQFLNSPNIANITFDVTLASTPVKRTGMHAASGTTSVHTPVKDKGRPFQDHDYSPLSTPHGITVKIETASTASSSNMTDITSTPSKRLFVSTGADTPRTPTPFKKALADLEKKSGPITNLPPDTPSSRLEDITEIMKKDQDTSHYETDTSVMVTNDSGYMTGKRKGGILAAGKENMLPNKRVRKALAPSWASSSSLMSSSDMSFAVETPSKSLGEDTSILFSTPSSIMKDSLGVSELMDFPPQTGSSKRPVVAPASSSASQQGLIIPRSTAAKRITFEEVHSPPPKLDYNWIVVACGRTQDQLEMTEKAHRFLKTTGLKPRSLHF